MLGSHTVTHRKLLASASSSWMYSYSLRVVSPATHPDSAACQDGFEDIRRVRRRAEPEPAPTIVVRFVHERSGSAAPSARASRSESDPRIWPRSIVPATIAFNCSSRPGSRAGAPAPCRARTRSPPRKPFGDGVLPVVPRSASPNSRRSPMTEDFEHLLDFLAASEDRGSLSCRASRFVAKCFRNGGSSEALLEALLAQLEVPHPRVRRVTMPSGSTRWRRRMDTGTPCVSSKTAENRSAASAVSSHTAGVMSASLKPSFVAGDTRSPVRRTTASCAGAPSMACRIVWGLRLDVAHHFREHVPLDLCERQEMCSLVSSACSRRRASSIARFDDPGWFRQSCSVRCRGLPTCTRPPPQVKQQARTSRRMP